MNPIKEYSVAEASGVQNSSWAAKDSDMEQQLEQWEVGGPYPSVSVITMIDAGCGGPEPEQPTYDLVCWIDKRTEGEQSQEALRKARIIAAAPELLAAAQNLWALLDEVDPNSLGEETDRVFARWEFKELRDAIDKALGR